MQMEALQENMQGVMKGVIQGVMKEAIQSKKAQTKETQTKDTQPENFLNLKKLTLLYAEDEKDSQEILASMLEDYVGKILVANNGLEAWNLFQNEQVDIVLTDILMPHVNGIELLRHIREHTVRKDTPVVLISALTDTHYFLNSIKLKCNGYVLKPVLFDELLVVLSEAVLPFMQQKEIMKKNQLLAMLNILFGGKKVEIVQYLFEHCSEDQIFYGTHDDIANDLKTTRQTVAACIKELAEFGLLHKIRNKTYMLKNITTSYEELPLFESLESNEQDKE